jgi:DNA-directed RNA polymerase specialized sigma subunit
MWINAVGHQNCTLIASKKGPLSLQQIGDILGVTRMRICQIEKKVVEKLTSFTN